MKSIGKIYFDYAKIFNLKHYEPGDVSFSGFFSDVTKRPYDLSELRETWQLLRLKPTIRKNHLDSYSKIPAFDIFEVATYLAENMFPLTRRGQERVRG